MSNTEAIDILKQSMFYSAVSRFKDQDDWDLETFITKNAITIQGMDSVAKAGALLGEMEACKFILEGRKLLKEQREIVNDTAKTWRKILLNKKIKAIENLPAASCYNGQLVVAALQDQMELEDGKNYQWSEEDDDWITKGYLDKNEILYRAEELQALDASDYDKLLDDLMDEGIIDCDKNGKYCVLHPCTKSFLPEDPLEWAKEQYNSSYGVSLNNRQRAFLEELLERNRALSEFDFAEQNDITIMHPNAYMNSIGGTYDISPRIYSDLDLLVKHGVLTKIPVPVKKWNFNLYYFKLIGEKEEA